MPIPSGDGRTYFEQLIRRGRVARGNDLNTLMPAIVGNTGLLDRENKPVRGGHDFKLIARDPIQGVKV